ncbi:hypothetical protein [Maribacter stanieri]|jgi:hypothetical protein|uniref:hypothetical protein n=1 Tax=Maribacter stanieri TaxID=440514 RepID=UPI0024941AA0|nr:hypothetical protein [Maribacter stanieri]|tara:strand:+ start:778 stop:1875 length:1098 start_codon:yes stop_codon:yes gene_type:complete
MLKNLDNRFSLSIPELQSDIETLLDTIDLNKEIERNVNLIKKYLKDDNLYNDWVQYLDEQIHLSIPDAVKKECKFCIGVSEVKEEMACTDYFIEAKNSFYFPVIMHVGLIENNQHIFKSKELIQSLTIKLFENFEFSEGKLLFNAQAYDSMLLTNSLMLLRESFKELETREAIKVISEAIEELETHKVIAKSTKRMLFDFVKPQIKFLKSQLKYFYKKLLTEPLKESKRKIDREALFKSNNNLIPKVSIEQVYYFFKVLTLTTNANDEFYLTEEKLLIFIESTFVKLRPIKQEFNTRLSRDKINVRSVFQFFLIECSKFENNNKNLKKKYFDIMNNGFEGFNKTDFAKFHKTNNRIPTVKLHKSK